MEICKLTTQSVTSSRLSSAYAAVIVCTLLSVGFASVIINDLTVAAIWHVGFIIASIGLLASLLYLVVHDAGVSITAISDHSSIRRLCKVLFSQHQTNSPNQFAANQLDCNQYDFATSPCPAAWMNQTMKGTETMKDQMTTPSMDGDVRDSMDALRSDVAALKADLKNLGRHGAAEVSRSTSNLLNSASQSAHKLTDEAKAKAELAQQRVGEFASERPLTTIILALLAGAIIGKIITWSSRSR